MTDDRAPTLTARFRDALVYAAALHATQHRKGTRIPYVGHLLIVAGYVIEDGGSEDEAIAAVLHDAIEDQGGGATEAHIRVRFGEAVAALVRACSDSDGHPKPPWKERKRRYIEHLSEAPQEVLRISAADKLQNARAILRDYRALGEALWGRFNADREEILWYYRSLSDLFHSRKTSGLTEEFTAVVEELEAEVARRRDGAGRRPSAARAAPLDDLTAGLDVTERRATDDASVSPTHARGERRRRPRGSSQQVNRAFNRELLEREFDGRFDPVHPYTTLYQSRDQVVLFRNFNQAESDRLWYRIGEDARRILRSRRKEAKVFFTNAAERIAYRIPFEDIEGRAATKGRGTGDLEVNIDAQSHRWIELDWSIRRYLRRYP